MRNKCIFQIKKREKHSEEGGYFKGRFICAKCREELLELIQHLGWDKNATKV